MEQRKDSIEKSIFEYNGKISQDFIVEYHGAVMKGRGIESLIKVVGLNKNIKGMILGNSSNEYRQDLKQLAIDCGALDKIVFHNAVPYTEIWKYVGAVDVSLILATATCKNHLYSLPNKFFESIQSETPIICPNYPAMKYIIDNYEIGLTCNPESIDEINICIEQLRTDRDFYDRLKDNLKKAKNDLCWEIEKQVLISAYNT